jgi:hypothetical protein
MPSQKSVSDTVTVRPDGSIVVDIPKLLAKKHIQDMIRQMRAKTRTVPARRHRAETNPYPSSTD